MTTKKSVLPVAQMENDLKALKKRIELARQESLLGPFIKLVNEAHKTGKVDQLLEACRAVVSPTPATIQPEIISPQNLQVNSDEIIEETDEFQTDDSIDK